MKKLRKPLIALAIVAAVLALAAYVTRPREPVYEGKRLSEWLEGAYGDFTTEGKLAVALRAMGTNSLPFLLSEIKAKQTKLDSLIDWFESHVPNFPALNDDPDLRRGRASIAIQLLGETALPILPELTVSANDPELTHDIVWTFPSMGTNGVETLFKLDLEAQNVAVVNEVKRVFQFLKELDGNVASNHPISELLEPFRFRLGLPPAHTPQNH